MFSGALVEKSNYFVTLPYIDLLGAGLVISLVSTITKSDSFTIGVMAMDLTLGSFYYTATRQIPECKLYMCMIINNAGFITVHKKWIESNTADEDVLDVHLVQEEPFIADTLIKEQVMRPTRCTDMAKSFKEREYWNVELTHERYFGIYFKMTAITGTNLFLITKISDPGTIPQECDLSCGSDCPAGKSCHCPCVTDTNSYEYCTASLNTTSSVPCAPKLPVSESDSTSSEAKPFDLAPCRDYKCGERTSKEECFRVLSCSWCSVTHEGEPCEYCSTDSTCSDAVQHCGTTTMATETPTTDNGSWFQKWEFWLILGSILLIGIGVAAMVTYLCMKRKQKNRASDPYGGIRLPNSERVRPDNDPIYLHTPTPSRKKNEYLKPPAPHMSVRPKDPSDRTNRASELSEGLNALADPPRRPDAGEPGRDSTRQSHQYAEIAEDKMDKGRESYMTPRTIAKMRQHNNPCFEGSQESLKPPSANVYDPFKGIDSEKKEQQNHLNTVLIAAPVTPDLSDLND